MNTSDKSKFKAKNNKPNQADSKGYYKIMGLEVGAEVSEIKAAYRSKAKELHPDYNKAPDAEFSFSFLKEANDILSDDLLRNIYNISVISEYVINADRKFLIDYHFCSSCGCIPLQPRIIASSYGEQILCFDCAKKLKKKQIQEHKSYQMLLEQMLVFISLDQKENAVIAAKQSLMLANSDLDKKSLENIIKILDGKGEFDFKNDWAEPKIIFKPKLAAKVIAFCLILFFIFKGIVEFIGLIKSVTLTESRTVNVNISNAIGQKVYTLPVKLSDDDLIYHLTKNADVFYGPSTEDDLLRSLEKEATVRVTGIVLNTSWVRIMMTDGIVGFIVKNNLQKGFGENELPIDNLIFDNTPLISEEK